MQAFDSLPRIGLTLNLGLRYEIQTMPALKGNPLEPRTGAIPTDTNNFGPRFGLSWDPAHDQKTVIRLGGGSRRCCTEDVPEISRMLAGPTHCKQSTGPRNWRARVDPFQNAWPLIEQWRGEMLVDEIWMDGAVTSPRFEPGLQS